MFLNQLESVDRVKRMEGPASYRKRSTANFRTSIEKIRSLTSNSFYKMPNSNNFEIQSKDSIFKFDIKKIRPSSINSVSSTL
jgi:hypothetical protein